MNAGRYMVRVKLANGLEEPVYQGNNPEMAAHFEESAAERGEVEVLDFGEFRA